jgi:hypothetical protein
MHPLLISCSNHNPPWPPPPPVRQDSTSNPERRKTKIEDRKVAGAVLFSGVSWLIFLKGGVVAGFQMHFRRIVEMQQGQIRMYLIAFRVGF